MGDEVFPCGPKHLYGPDLGSSICPILKYGRHWEITVILGVEKLSKDTFFFLLKLNETAESYKDDLRVFVYIGEKSD